MRCTQCQIVFCADCKRNPYHVGFTCEQAAHDEVARKCRFCQEEMSGKSRSDQPCFKDVCQEKDCLEVMFKTCAKMHPCGHPCCGFKDEKQCLPCLEPECAEKHNAVALPKKRINETIDDYCIICYTEGLRAKPCI